MLRAVSVKARGAWKGDAIDVVMLDHTQRARSQITVTGLRGNEIFLGFEDRVTLRNNDALVTDKGEFVEVIGKPEPLMEIRPASEADLVRIAWQLGNHHLAMQIVGGKIRTLANDAVAASMLGMGAKVLKIEAPFDPEGGAYLAPVEDHHDHGPGCGCGHHHHDHGHHDHHHHDHGHHHAHAHDHGHDHKHGDACCGGHHHDHDHKHEHGQGCCGGHGHGHKHD